MQGLMMEAPLTVRAILDRATTVFPEKRVYSRPAASPLAVCTYGELGSRVLRAISLLEDVGVRRGDRVATFAWNTHRHLELYFAIPCMGAVAHTLNVRLARDQVAQIINHAGDTVLCVDRSLLPLVAEAIAACPSLHTIVVLPDGSDAPIPEPCMVIDYEDALATRSECAHTVDLDEREAAGMCYTSATTGEPKGVLYSHRSFYLHAMGISMTDALRIGERETVLSIVPMFHANAWGLPHACALTGADLVLPGPHLQGGQLAEMINATGVTMAAGVPTVATLLLQHCRQQSVRLPSLRTMIIGGAAASRALIEGYDRELGIEVVHAWGMTEMSPVGTVCRLRRALDGADPDARMAARAKQGVPIAGVEARALDDADAPITHDGQCVGELVVRGPWVAASYYLGGGDDGAFTADGWFRTGDIVTIDGHYSMEIKDRKKDLIKTRGEWISSVQMEGVVMGVRGVLEATVVGRPDTLRDEAPVVFAVRNPVDTPEATVADVQAALRARFARWQVPRAADVRFVDAIPKTSVGKFDKKALRARLRAEHRG